MFGKLDIYQPFKMIRFILNILFALVTSAYVMKVSDNRIIGGKKISIEDAPYQIGIRNGDRHSCGGSIISSTFVLTAAHCVLNVNKERLRVRAGTANRENGGTMHTIVNVTKHKFQMTSNFMPVNDIALLEVNPPFEFGKKCAPVSLYDLREELNPGSIASVSGWGRTVNGTKSLFLEAVEVPIVSKEECKKAYKNLPEGEICAMHMLGGRDSCQGDSGGPLVIKKRLAGIISWGFGCGVKGKPGVYTEVAYYANWIKENTGL